MFVVVWIWWFCLFRFTLVDCIVCTNVVLLIVGLVGLLRGLFSAFIVFSRFVLC